MSYVAISKVSFPASEKEGIKAVGLAMVEIAKTQPGFVSIAFHESDEGNETMMYWVWETKEDHENCMKSDVWLELMQKSRSLFSNQEVTFSITTYTRIA